MTLDVLPEALADTQDAYNRLLEDNPAYADRFLDILDRAYDLIERNPNIGRPSKTRNIREWSARDWPYIIPIVWWATMSKCCASGIPGGTGQRCGEIYLALNIPEQQHILDPQLLIGSKAAGFRAQSRICPSPEHQIPYGQAVVLPMMA
jgi:plasmid stabilization system protein ParE